MVEYAGPQGEFARLDQVNVRLPRILAGAGFRTVRIETAGEKPRLTTDGTLLLK